MRLKLLGLLLTFAAVFYWQDSTSDDAMDKYISEYKKFQAQADSASKFADSLAQEVVIAENEARAAQSRAVVYSRQATELKNETLNLMDRAQMLTETITDTLTLARELLPIKDSIITKQETTITDNTLRKFIRITLSHNEKDSRCLTRDAVHNRVSGLFTVVRAICAKESHEDGGHHYHYIFENTNASKNTATRKIRDCFPEWDQGHIDVKFHRGWGTMLKYATKEDPEWKQFIFGNYNILDAEEELQATVSKTLNAVRIIRKHVANGGSVDTLALNDTIAPFMLRSAQSVIRFTECVQNAMPQRNTLEIISQLSSGLSSQDVDQFASALNQAQLDSLQNFVGQLQGRKPRQPQVYCLGPTHTGKSYLFQLLSQHTRCFIPCLENNDRAFSGYDDKLHDWIFINDFHDNIRFQLLSLS